MSKEEFQARIAARAVGEATGAGIVVAPEIGAFARGLWYAVTGYFMTPKGQETAASVLEGLSDARRDPSREPRTAQPSELDSAKRLMSQYGLDLKVAAIKVFSDETEALR
jgi:hypothetical protein